MYLLSLLKEQIRAQTTHTGGQPCEDTEKVAICKPSRQVSERNQPCQHLDLVLPASRLWRNKCLLFKPPILLYLLWQPYQANIKTILEGVKREVLSQEVTLEQTHTIWAMQTPGEARRGQTAYQRPWGGNMFDVCQCTSAKDHQECTCGWTKLILMTKCSEGRTTCRIVQCSSNKVLEKT